jgi:hypothetical protein
VRCAGSGTWNNGRSWWIRSNNTVLPRVHPTRRMITVDGIVGNSASNALICGSTASTMEPFASRRYRGGSSLAKALFTVFRAIPNRRAMAWIAKPSARRSRRISAQSSTLNTS